MVKHIEIGGKTRPVHFGYGALMMFEDITGESAIEFFVGLSQGKPITISKAVELVRVGLVNGARIAGEPLEIESLQVADWMDTAQADGVNVFEAIAQIFAESMPQDDGLEKKTKQSRPHGRK